MMSVEQLCMVAMVLMFGGFLVGVWREASRWMREANEPNGEIWESAYDTRDMEVASSAALIRLGARARLHEMRSEHQHPVLRVASNGMPTGEHAVTASTAPPAHLMYGVQSMGDHHSVRLDKNYSPAPAHYARSTTYHN